MILLEFLLVTLSQCVIEDTGGRGGGREAAGLGAETEQGVIGLFYFFPS